MSSYQRAYWYPRVAEMQHGEFCKGCGFAPTSQWLARDFTGLVIDKINNDGNHNICDNLVSNFQLLCYSCNRIKNPQAYKPEIREMTESERTNRRAEKPLMEWLFELIRKGEQVSWSYFVSEGSYKFDISPETIERRYYRKYFEAASAPFMIIHNDETGTDDIVFKKREMIKSNLDIDTHPDRIQFETL